MSFGNRLLEVRKKKSISQEELARQLGTKGPVVGRYERDEAKPSIEVAARIADILGVSLDYLVGNSDTELDTRTVGRIIELQSLPDEIRDKLYFFIDMTIRDFKAKQAYS
jgi:transcriptional regulator with XRE-family HTH domain